MKKYLLFMAVGLLMGAGSLGSRMTALADAKDATVTGEVIDTYCYASMGAHGESHRSCGLECARKGIPVGLLEDKTNKVYVLLPDKDKSPLPETVIDKMGRKAVIKGHVYTSGGTQFLTVETVQ